MKPVDAVGTLFPIKVDDHLRVALRGEAVAAALELRPKLTMIADLPVEDHHNGAILVMDRLVAGVDIGDTQAVSPPARCAADG